MAAKNRVLIIDDEQVNYTLLKELTLSYNPEIEVVVVDNASEGLFHYLTSSFTLVFLDIMMPIIDGNDFLAVVDKNRRAGHLQNSPNIVVQTAIQSITQLTDLTKWECVQEVLRKPIAAQRLQECLGRYCD